MAHVLERGAVHRVEGDDPFRRVAEGVEFLAKEKRLRQREPREMITVPCIDCSPGGTGICVHLVRPGTDADLGEDGAVTGTVAINQLDDTGYDIVVDATFSDGTTITGLQVTG